MVLQSTIKVSPGGFSLCFKSSKKDIYAHLFKETYSVQLSPHLALENCLLEITILMLLASE